MIQKDQNEQASFFSAYSPGTHINLNPGGLGTPAKVVRDRTAYSIDESDSHFHHLGHYQEYLKVGTQIAHHAQALWPSPEFSFFLTGSGSEICKFLALSLAGRNTSDQTRPHVLLTSEFEHPDALLPFESHPKFKVIKASDDELLNSEKLSTLIQIHQPDSFLLSVIRWNTQEMIDAETICQTVRRTKPDTLIIVDAAQALGISEFWTKSADILFASAHKWLAGPPATGFCWVKKDKVKDLHFRSADYGQLWGGPSNIATLRGLAEALRLHQEVGLTEIQNSSIALTSYFKKNFLELLSARQIEFAITPSVPWCLVVRFLGSIDLLPIYQSLNAEKIHFKMITEDLNGRKVQAFRFGFPYYETETRLHFVLKTFRNLLDLKYVAPRANAD